MGMFAFGQAVPREEDPRLLRGHGDYIADKNLPGQAYAYLLRSPHAHARIVSIDTTVARAMPGVVAVFTGDDIAAERLGARKTHFPRRRPDGSPMLENPHPCLARGQVRFAGDPVAYIVGETAAHAKDAAEAVSVEYAALPAVVHSEDAVAPGASAVWDECPDNISHLFETGDKAAVDAAFARAHHITRQRFVISRIGMHAIEPRGCIGEYDADSRRYTLHACIGSIHGARAILAGEVLRIPEHRLRVVSGDIGGTFGSKGQTSNENILALWAARKTGRPVKWVAERSEAFLCDEHGRDNVTDAELALDQDGQFLALRVNTLCNLGAYVSADVTVMPTFINLGTLAGVYRTPAIHVAVHAMLCNTASTASCRGAGRPEACYVIEGMIDRAARELGYDRAELRRRNMIPPSAMPYKTALSFTYDCGEFEKVMDIALEKADWRGFEARRAEAGRRGRLRGIGIANPIERAAGPPGSETVEMRFDASGSMTMCVGTTSQGQGHETMYKLLASHSLGIDADDIRVIQGDTDKVAWGTGTWGSRSAGVGGSAAKLAADKIIAKGRKISAHLLEAAEADIGFERGVFRVSGTDRRVTLKEVARAAFQHGRLPQGMEPGLFETAVFDPPGLTFPNGCQICEVEIDPETGRLEIARFVVVDDVGNVINPLTLEGQIHGGVAMGAGQAVVEQMVYDRSSGQLTTGSFMDYCLPRADDICAIETADHPVPTKQNPLGVKGAGEAGTVGAIPAVMSAAVDALAPLGIRHIEMPLTPEKIWRAISSSKEPHHV
jgi:carbon-monoxide dehydrogenase large subunit